MELGNKLLGTHDEFNCPCDVVVCKTDARIFVSDSYNHRTQVFSSDGRFLFKFGSYGTENGPHGLSLSNCSQFLLVSSHTDI